MKKNIFILAFMLMVACILVGCQSETGNTGESTSGVVTKPTENPNEEDVSQSANAILDYEDVSITGKESTISVKIPAGWKCEVCPEGSEDLVASKYGFHIYPENVSEGFIELGYYNLFGVCGTGLTEEKTKIAGVTARIGTYDDNDFWDFITFGEGNIVATTYAVDTWFSEYESQILDILNTMEYVLFTDSVSMNNS